MSPTATYEEKILKLLAKAESTTPEEAEALTAAAERLMLKYSIDQAMIDQRRAAGGQKSEEAIVTKKIYFTGIYAGGFVMMGHYVASAAGNLRTLKSKGYDPTTGKKAETLWVIGFESDVQQMETLILSLQLQAMTAMSKWWKSHKDEIHQSRGYIERRSFIISFGAGAGERIKLAHKDVVKEAGTGAELAVIDRKKKIDQWMDQNMSTSKGRGGLSAGVRGSNAGRAAGRNANTGGSSLGGSRKALS